MWKLTDEINYYRERADANWLSWRLVIPYGISYSDMKQMNYDELMEANQAMNIYIEKQNEQIEQAKASQGGND